MLLSKFVGSGYNPKYKACNKTDVAELVVFSILFIIILFVFFGTNIHKKSADEMEAWGYMTMITMGELFGFVLAKATQITMCALVGPAGDT